jgi:hypothetical protein
MSGALDSGDHKVTSSYGPGGAARNYRDQLKGFIDSTSNSDDGFYLAFEKDVLDIEAKFPTGEYAPSVNEARQAMEQRMNDCLLAKALPVSEGS